MRFRLFWNDSRGSVLVESAITLPFFILLVFSLVEIGMLLWTQVGLQHAVELAARCASVNTSTCGTQSAIQSFAAANSLSVNPPSTTFTVTLNTTCGGNPANLVTASYGFPLFGIYVVTNSSLTLTAQSCYPTQPS